MLDKELAELYGVSTGRLKQQVRRNLKRFPSDFAFELTWERGGRNCFKIAFCNLEQRTEY